MSDEKSLRIVRLEASNVKRLSAVEITPDGNLVVIGGQNGAGKSSVLDSIAYALGGKDALCEEPLRQGMAKGHVVVDLGDLVVRRTFSVKSGSAVTVEGKDGAVLKSPQALLDRLVGRLSFDPLAFSRMDAKAQRETLRQLVGLDFAALDAARATFYEQRTGVNRDAKGLEARIAAMPVHPDALAAPVSVKELLEDLAASEVTQRAVATAEREQSAALTEGERWIARVKALDQRIAELQTERSTAVASGKQATAKAGELLARAAAIATEAIDPAPIREQIAAAEGINAKVAANRARASYVSELRASREAGETLTEKIDALDGEKAAALAGAKFPVDGLALDDAGVRLNGLPFSQASSAEQLRVSVAMGIAANPRLRVLLIRDGSLLDEHSLRIVAEMAKAADAQVWLERVGEGAECSVVIEDGAVRAAEVAA